MKFLVQRVREASVTTEGQVIGKIGRGFLVLAGVTKTDTKETADKMIKKLIDLRIFPDEDGKINLDLKAVGGELLIISQFTLCADCRRGHRPSFTDAGDPEMANELYQYIIARCRQEIAVVEEGSFGAHMDVALVNDGPFTVMLDSEVFWGGDDNKSS